MCAKIISALSNNSDLAYSDIVTRTCELEEEEGDEVGVEVGEITEDDILRDTEFIQTQVCKSVMICNEDIDREIRKSMQSGYIEK